MDGAAIREIDVEELDRLRGTGELTLIDVREPSEYQLRRIPGARLVPLGQFPGEAPALPRTGSLAIVCEHGQRSYAATQYLLRLGFHNAVSVRGGTDAWVRSGRPVERGWR